MTDSQNREGKGFDIRERFSTQRVKESKVDGKYSNSHIEELRSFVRKAGGKWGRKTKENEIFNFFRPHFSAS